MARQKGSFELAGTLEIMADSAVDARTIVANKADLTAAASYDYKYVGMIVSVQSEGKAYMLIGYDHTDPANWKEVGGDTFPAGGTTGQALVKKSATDGDVEWKGVILSTEKGAASGVAELDLNGKVPASQLPSFVDDVVEGFFQNGKFYKDSSFTTEITSETGKIYVDKITEKTYRWSGGSATISSPAAFTVGQTYRMGGYDWLCAEDLGSGVYALQSKGMTSGAWPGYRLPSNYDGSVSFGPADTPYSSDIFDLNIASYDSNTIAFYDTNNWKSVCADNKGLYLISYTKLNVTDYAQLSSGNYSIALKEAASNYQNFGMPSNADGGFAWIGNVSANSSSDPSPSGWWIGEGGYVGANSVGQMGTYGQGAVIAPAFDVDSSKVSISPTNEIGILLTGSFVEISESLALGETSSTAYAGNKGKKNADDIADIKNLLASIQSSISSVEADASAATSAHAVDDLITISGVLYKVTSAIAIGDAITSGTNVTATTIEAEIQNAVSNGGGGSLAAILNVSKSTGGIESGTSYAAGTTFETLWRDLLDPIAYPTLTAPSATLTATGAKLLEVGATLATTMTVAFNRGSISPAYGTSGFRSGEAVDYSLNSGTAQVSNTFNVTVSEAEKTYQASVTYAAGEQPKDSKGSNYSTPLAGGSVNSNTITYEFVHALWANTSSAASITKQALVSKSAKQKEFAFPATTATDVETFDVPASFNVTAVEVLNTLSNTWENAASQFTITSTTHDDAAGSSVNYNRYSCSLGYSLGARKIRVKWS